MKTVAIIIPIFNNSSAIKLFYDHLKIVINSIKDHNFIICFIDDGSSDKSSEIIKKLIHDDKRVKLVILTRNFGKEAALSAGLDYVKADAVIPMDVDLQDPPELIKKMISIWSTGVPLVLARRISRKDDTLFKRFTADIFYYVHNKLSSIKIPKNVGEFRLMDKCVVDSVKLLPEKVRFMKGIFAWVGYDFHIIDFARPKRSLGESGFNALQLLNLAKDGIFSFSLAPLKLSSIFGYFGAFSSLMYGLYILFRTLFYGVDSAGFPSLMVAILFIGSLNLIFIGILGEYIGRIYIESKNRPIYLIKNILETDA